MSGFRLTLRAVEDLEQISDFVGQRNPAGAVRLLAILLEKFETLAEFPYIGQAAPAFGDGVRIFPARNYVIYYRAKPDRIEVLRVVHGARNFETLEQD